MKQLLTDSHLSHYRIVRGIGAGGMGEVYLAEDTRLDRRVALKILPEEFAADKDRMSRFVREAKLASALNHPNIITIYEIGEADGTHFIATEFIDGKTLNEYAKSNPLNFKSALEIAIQVGSALDEAHQAGIVHRDIKPDNIMIRANVLAKILDFGIAKLSAPTESNEEAATAIQSQTQAGMIIGTPNYMSPEQARGKGVDHRTDIFSFGVVLYEMLSGSSPFAGETISDIIAAILTKEPEPLADIPNELAEIVLKTLQKDKQKRYQTAKDLLRDLKEVKQELEIQSRLEKTSAPNLEEPKTQILKAQTTAENETRNSIAVLPFTNMSADAENEYFCDGLAEELLNALSKIDELKVTARTSAFSFKGKNANVSEIGQKLSVKNVLEGSVRKSGNRLRISVQLVNAVDGYHLWSERYDREMKDIFDVQDEIALAVVDALKLKLFGDEKAAVLKRGTENKEAYELYLKGRYYWYKFPAKEFEKSGDYYQQAIDVDPNYALAYAGLSEYYGFGAWIGFLPPTNENWSKSAAAVNKALALDDTLPDAYNALAGIKQINNDRAGAERDLRRAIELNPNYAEGCRHYAMFLIEDGRSEEALAQMRKGLELEPLSVPSNIILAVIFYRTRQSDRAIEQYQKTLELDPNDAYTHELLGDTYEQKGMQKEAVAQWSRALTLTGDNESATMLERTFAASGFNAAVRSLWQEKLERFNEKTRRGEYVPAMNYALAYTRLADKEQAFAWLAKAEQERNGLLRYAIKLDPIYDSLRDDSRFKDLLKRMGLPE